MLRTLQKLPVFGGFVLVLISVFGCGKTPRSTTAVTPPANISKPPTAAAMSSASNPTAMMTTNFPNGDRAILVWSFMGVKHLNVSFAGHDFNLSTDSAQISVKLDLTKGPNPNETHVSIVTTAGEKSSSTTELSVGGLPSGDDNKPLAIAALLTPVVTKEQPLKAGQTIVVAKGAGAFPSLTATMRP